MTKYLNAEDMLNNYEADCEVYENNGDSLDTESWMMDYLKNHSSADVQQVVHCKDCIHRYNADNSNICPMFESHSEYNESWEEWEEIDIDNTDDDNFCKYGDEHDNG